MFVVFSSVFEFFIEKMALSVRELGTGMCAVPARFFPKRKGIFLSLLAAAFIFSPLAYATESLQSEVVIQTAKKEIVITVEIADTPFTRARGLMYRDSLAEGHGMLFIFEAVQPVTMWMKNTYIPLDILFLDEQGRIVHIAYSTTPLSLSYISSRFPVLGALEVNAGFARKEGISVGDRVLHPAFQKALPPQEEQQPTSGKNMPSPGKDLLFGG